MKLATINIKIKLPVLDSVDAKALERKVQIEFIAA